MNTAISVRGISKTYPNGKRALNRVNFDLYYGQLVGLIGPNGAGKSTLIHIIAGVLKQDEGSLYCNITNANELAWVSQFSSIDWYLSVIDNVRLGARLGGYSSQNAEDISKDCLIKVELNHKIYCLPDALSGGEQRRVQIARALAQNPKILILDEPTTGLDPIASKKLMHNLRSLANQNYLVIVSSHDLHVIEDSVDQILFLKEGEIIANEKKKSIVNIKSLIHVEYKGILNEKLEEMLVKFNVKILSKNPLEMECCNDIPYKGLFEILFSHNVEITDIRITKNDLYQYYLSLGNSNLKSDSIDAP